MVVRIDIPEDITRTLSEHWGDVPRHLLETLAAEGYRSSVLTEYQVGRLLGFNSREEISSFLAEHGLFPEYSEAELDRDLDIARQVAQKHDLDKIIAGD